MELHRNTTPIQMRNYGRIVQDMIGYACSLPVGPERDSLEVYIAQCMRQRNLIWNRDQEAGIQRVFEQLMAQPNAQLMGKKKKK